MSLMECAHCGRLADARSMWECPACEGMVCAHCADEGVCDAEDLF